MTGAIFPSGANSSNKGVAVADTLTFDEWGVFGEFAVFGASMDKNALLFFLILLGGNSLAKDTDRFLLPFYLVLSTVVVCLILRCFGSEFVDGFILEDCMRCQLRF